MKLIEELNKFKENDNNIYVLLNQILNINDILYNAKNKLYNFDFSINFHENELFIVIVYFEKRAGLKVDYDIESLTKTVNMLNSSFENELNDNFFKLFFEQTGEGFKTKIKNYSYSELMLQKYTGSVLKNDGRKVFDSYDVFINSPYDMEKLPPISTIKDFENMLNAFDILLK